MPTRRELLASAGVTVLAGCAGQESINRGTSVTDTEPNTRTQTSSPADTPTETTETATGAETDTETEKTETASETMTDDPPEILTEDTHPLELDAAPPESWKWEGTAPADVDSVLAEAPEAQLAARVTYAQSLDTTYYFLIRRFESAGEALEALEIESGSSSGFSGKHVGVQRGRFLFIARSENGGYEGDKELLARATGLDREYVENEAVSWEI